MKQRGVSLEELPSSLGTAAAAAKASNDALAKTKTLVETDRTVMTKATKAFVSFIRAYQEHQLPFIFPMKSLDLGSLANCFCLLRIPRMKETLGKKIKGFIQSSIHPESVPFKDKGQEKQRQEKLKRLAEEAKEGEAAAEKKWKEEEKARKKREKEAEKERTRTQKRKAGKRGKLEEWQLLAAEERLAKQLRQGKITTKMFKKKLDKETKGIVKRSGEESGMSEDEDGPPKKKKRNGSMADDSDDDDIDGGAKWVMKRKRRGKKKKGN